VPEGERRRSHPAVVFVQRETTPLAGQLNGSIKVACPLRDRFAGDRIQELAAGLFQLRAPPASGKSGNPEKYFASNDGTGNHAITLRRCTKSLTPFVSRR